MQKQMWLKNIKPLNSDESVNAMIEISMNSYPVKYEFDKSVGVLFVDRFIQTPMSYPYNYGFIPNSLSQDGDPLDVIVLSRFPINGGAIIKSRPIAVLIMEDEAGVDEKIITVPISKIDKSYNQINDIGDLQSTIKEKITYFFEHYKDLEKDKWVKIKGWKGRTYAWDVINKAVLSPH